MVALSSSLMTVVSIALYHQLGGAESSIDPLRVIEGMAAAIGIIAAGLIIVKGGEVRNLTTAAHIWLTAAIGITSGAGYFAVVIIAAGLALVLLILLRFVERRLPEVEDGRSEEHTSELQSLMRNSYAVFCLKKKRIKIRSARIN